MDLIKFLGKSIQEQTKQAAGGDSLDDGVRNGITTAIYGFGIIAVIVIIIGAVNYSTSQGDPAKIKKGKDTIIYGVIGLVIAILAFAIVTFVLDNAKSS